MKAISDPVIFSENLCYPNLEICQTGELFVAVEITPSLDGRVHHRNPVGPTFEPGVSSNFEHSGMA